METQDHSELKAGKRPLFTLAIFALLGIWLVILLVVASWYQSNYIVSFTDNTPHFLDAQATDAWALALNQQLPAITGKGRIIQLWKPDCLCNRFARPHALKTVELAQTAGLEHLTIIPNATPQKVEELAHLNPNTRVISLNTDALDRWPNAPTVLYQSAIGQLMYFGPLGFGAFCSQSSASAIEQQVNNSLQGNSKPFYNVLGKGCFCSWNS